MALHDLTGGTGDNTGAGNSGSGGIMISGANNNAPQPNLPSIDPLDMLINCAPLIAA